MSEKVLVGDVQIGNAMLNLKTSSSPNWGKGINPIPDKCDEAALVFKGYILSFFPYIQITFQKELQRIPYSTPTKKNRAAHKYGNKMTSYPNR
jgi:hypothetical protein